MFDNPKAAEHFLSWLCEAGEQDYWEWMRCREQEKGGNITVVDFDYFNGHRKLGGSGVVPCKCGRLEDP